MVIDACPWGEPGAQHSGDDQFSRTVTHPPAVGGSWDRGCMSQGVSEGVRLTVEVYLAEDEWRWVVAERLDEGPGEGPAFTLWGDRWIASGAVPTLDRARSAINTAVVAEIRKCFA